MEYTAATVLANVTFTLLNLFILPLIGGWVLSKLPALRKLILN